MFIYNILKMKININKYNKMHINNTIKNSSINVFSPL